MSYIRQKYILSIWLICRGMLDWFVWELYKIHEHKYLKFDTNNSGWSFMYKPVNLREDDIINGECCRWSNIDGLFSYGGDVEGNSSLPLCFIEDSVHHLKCEHGSIHFYSNFLANLIKLISHEGLPSPIHNLQKKKEFWE